jgi:hypothetical protein
MTTDDDSVFGLVLTPVKKLCGHYQEWHLSQIFVDDDEAVKAFLAEEEKEPCPSCTSEVGDKQRPPLQYIRRAD